jgi:hypothetical protein
MLTLNSIVQRDSEVIAFEANHIMVTVALDPTMVSWIVARGALGGD